MKPVWIISCLCLLVSPVAAEPLRIATYNINWANQHGDQILDAIDEAQPDVICFQETTVASERFLRRSLEEAYPHFHSAGHHGRYGAERFAIASKTELSDVTFTPPDEGLFGFYAATIHLGTDTIRIVNVHLSPFGSDVATASETSCRSSPQPRKSAPQRLPRLRRPRTPPIQP